MDIDPKIKLDDLILKGFYGNHDGFDFIPATMFDRSDSSKPPKGLDDLEIEIARQYFGENTLLNHITMLAKFFNDSGIEKQYDFIFFDCPPANSLITQNALMVSEYYLIPCIMDDMSSYGIPHMHNLIQNTIFKQLKENYVELLKSASQNTYLEYLKKESPKLLGIFETLRKTNVDTSSVRNLVKKNHNLFDSVIYNHIDTARTTSDGLSCFSVNIAKDIYSPHVCYSKLIAELLQDLNFAFDKKILAERTYQYY